MTDDRAAVELFSLTNRQEVGDIFDFLRGLIHVLTQMYNNGAEPLLAYDFTDHNDEIRKQVRRVLGKLAA